MWSNLDNIVQLHMPNNGTNTSTCNFIPVVKFEGRFNC